MFGPFKKQRPAGPHPHRRELGGLLSCIVAWRRAVLEAQARDPELDAAMLAGPLEKLRAYAQAAGETDPFTLRVLGSSIGELEEPLFLEALYRIETAAGIAWALGLLDVLPPIEARADFEALGALYPLTAPPPERLVNATLRDSAVIAEQLSVWSSRLDAARKRHEQSPDDESAPLQFSRAFERTRGLAWVSGDTQYVEDTVMPRAVHE